MTSLEKHHTALGFIGSGNMASAIIAGLIARDYPAERILVSSPDSEQCTALKNAYGIQKVADNRALVAASELVFLCVKPQQAESVCVDIAAHWQAQRQTLVSIAAGLQISQLKEWLGTEAQVIRCMPNTPVQVQQGVSILFAEESVKPAHRGLCAEIFSAAGYCNWIDREEDMHAVTALSGSGPAYVFQFIEALQAAGEAMGLTRPLACALALETVSGAAALLRASDRSAGQLKQQVMSPGGTTERGIAALEAGGFNEVIRAAVLQARNRSYTLAGLSPPPEPPVSPD